MREFGTHITEGLLNGLRPERTIADSQYLADMYNIVPDELGARSYEALESLVDTEEEVGTYPFPQFFNFQKQPLILTEDTLFQADKSFVPFDLTEVLDITETDLTLLTKVLRGVDYGENWMLLGPQGAVYKFQGVLRTSVNLRANSILQYKNRTLIGGSSNGMWTEQWLLRIKGILSNKIDKLSPYSLPLSPNFILYSSFDSTDFPFALLHPEIVLTGTENADSINELFLSNEFGFIEMPFHGEVYDMIEAFDQVFVFGKDGIASIAMIPDASGAPFGITGAQPFGIKQRGAVGGGENSIVFIDVFDQLWQLTSSGMTKLGFSEYMSQLEGEIWITKDPDEDIFYIGDSAKSFLLKNGKLCRVFQTVSYASGEDAGHYGIIHVTGDEKAVIEVDRIDIGMAPLKTLTGIVVLADANFIADYQAFSDVKSKRISSKKVRANFEGYGATRLFGRNHAIKLEFSDYKDFQISRIELKWQIDDSRHTRGVFATEDATGTGQ